MAALEERQMKMTEMFIGQPVQMPYGSEWVPAVVVSLESRLAGQVQVEASDDGEVYNVPPQWLRA
jgi:hypothetical protein